jgi:hypothetical protein
MEDCLPKNRAEHRLHGEAVKQRRLPNVDAAAVRDLTLNPQDLALNPEQRAVGAQGKLFALRTLEEMPARDREALIRFYLQKQTAQDIEAALDMTDAQFRLIKSDARKRFAELLQHRTGGLGFDPGGKPAISGHATSNRPCGAVPLRAMQVPDTMTKTYR